MWSKLKQRFKRKKAPPKDEVCKNCETHFKGYYCPNCGQAVREYDRPFSFIFYNFLGDFFAFDTRFFKTTIDLLFRPGFLTKEYFEGRRVRYAPPFRIFIFASFILFLLLQIYTNRGLDKVLNADLSKSDVALDSASVASLDSIYASDIQHELPVDSAKNLDLAVNLENFRNGSLRQKLEKLADSMEEELAQETDPEEIAQKQELIRVLRSPEQVNARILKYMSWAFFLLLPIFALLLKLVYIRRRQNYMRHLIFSIHLHSFIFLLMTFIILLYMLLDGNLGWLTLILMLSIPVYTIIAMHKFYRQNVGKIIAKFIMVSFAYNIVFMAVLTFVAMSALHLI